MLHIFPHIPPTELWLLLLKSIHIIQVFSHCATRLQVLRNVCFSFRKHVSFHTLRVLCNKAASLWQELFGKSLCDSSLRLSLSFSPQRSYLVGFGDASNKHAVFSLWFGLKHEKSLVWIFDMDTKQGIWLFFCCDFNRKWRFGEYINIYVCWGSC